MRGVENRTTDGLLRMHEEGQLTVITIVTPKWYQEIMSSYANDQEVAAIIQQLEISPNFKPHFSLVNDLLRYKQKLYIGKQ